MSEPLIEEVRRELSKPFQAEEVKWKAQTVTKDKKRALAVAYVSARTVAERLDDTVGIGSWQDDYECLPDGSVICRLHLRLGGEWITKVDVGSQSDQPDEGDRRKAAFSDALKRAAVKFGIARYLYDLPKVWVGYDEGKKQLTETPKLPAWALPAKEPPSAPRTAPAAPAAKETPKAVPTERPAPASQAVPAPTDGLKPAEWKQWLGGEPSQEEVNAVLPELDSMGHAERRDVGRLIHEYAKGLGWQFDKEAKGYRGVA